jgi:hypothetical protein
MESGTIGGFTAAILAFRLDTRSVPWDDFAHLYFNIFSEVKHQINTCKPLFIKRLHLISVPNYHKIKDSNFPLILF